LREHREWFELFGKGGGEMSNMGEITLGRGDNITARPELETELDEVIKSLEEAAQEIEKLSWEKEESTPAN
jgi:hypothetical protein